MARIAWLIPRLIDGSGGHRTMLLHAWALENHGHHCSIYIEGRGDNKTAARQIEKMFGFRFEDVRFGWETIQPADLVLATVWYSAAVVHGLSFPCRKAYFVQDLESCFYPQGDAFLAAENSYTYGLTPITIGRWLRRELEIKFGVPAFHFDFGADLSVYRRTERARKELAVCFIHQPDKPRRCSRLGIQALSIVKHVMPEVKIYLYGSNDKGPPWLSHENLGLLSPEKCNELYNRCVVGLCLSSSNPSRIPFEMMAAGLPVVEVWRPNTLYDFPGDAMLLCNQRPEAIADGLLAVLNDEARQRRMSKVATEFMAGRSISMEIEQFVNVVNQVLKGEVPRTGSHLPEMYQYQPFVSTHASIELSYEVKQRLITPFNAGVNNLPPPLRKLVAVGARFARRVLETR